MQLTFLLFQIGSFFLGVTFAFAILFHIASGHTNTNATEGCLGVLLCTLGVSVALLCYVAAVNV